MDVRHANACDSAHLLVRVLSPRFHDRCADVARTAGYAEMVEHALRWKASRSMKSDGYPIVDLTFGDRKYRIRQHRIVWALVHGRRPTQIDHEKGVEAGNGIGNLREATTSENAQNRKKRADNTSGFSGVTWHKRTRKWHGRIKIDGHRIHLGDFDTPELAYAAYLIAKREFTPSPRRRVAPPKYTCRT